MKWQFGPYRVEGLIARGGMGEILRAYDTRHDRVVALKLLAANLAADEEFRDRFKQEAHAAGRLREPHVIPIHAYGEIDGRLYLDMRLVEGSDVGSLLAANGPMRPADAVIVLEQIAQALDAAHAEGLVHRDVKPSNILVGENGFAYLVDFGIAASLRASASLTSTGYTVGTLAYMAPERFDDGPVDHRADVYSLACVLYQCLTGGKPFEGETAASLINAHLNHQPPLPTAARDDIPGEFDHIVARGMAKNPADRYASAGELARAARQALTSVTAMPAAFVMPPAAPRRRVRWPYVAAGVGALAVVAGAVALATTMRTEPGQAVPVEVPTSLSGTGETTSPPTGAPSSEPPAELPPVEQSVSEETEPGGDPETKPAEPKQTKWCQTISYQGETRGSGCFEAIGDHLFAHDTSKDGMWIKTVAETDYGRVVECKDTNSQGDPVDCNFDLSEKGRVRFKVELWDAKVKLSDTVWSDYVPIGQ
ncbi:serine/threonine protein kinase [Saccharopolyspora antimicrobica]|uniref:non-specific serine/threonine protein kinase n=1 Tax=Saccharopolyspora antimicrobica TaxID=455193 RepID=A0A1I5MAB2_9PSEU|nr:serine/threonine-protein kinase [Saccharopolyspora antimicrobica]RKT88437.1 serine/threonine-protein kinase [Saccharopolyspora antimicrobica]SFP06287.1 serine/threonine protein kinase [Saccharopolyspora antimicrobica]